MPRDLGAVLVVHAVLSAAVVEMVHSFDPTHCVLTAFLVMDEAEQAPGVVAKAMLLHDEASMFPKPAN
jgi:hypothetical protein